MKTNPASTRRLPVIRLIVVGPVLTADPVQPDDLQGGRGCTPGNDPRHKFNARAGAETGAQAARVRWCDLTLQAPSVP